MAEYGNEAKKDDRAVIAEGAAYVRSRIQSAIDDDWSVTRSDLKEWVRELTPAEKPVAPVDPGPSNLLWAMTRNEQQKDVAERLGISAQYLCDVLKGRREMSAALALRLGYQREVTFTKIESGKADPAVVAPVDDATACPRAPTCPDPDPDFTRGDGQPS